MTIKPSVIDFFCGAGGFSEGFRQQGFDVIMGIDNWRPAIETHNLNHQLADVPVDVLRFENEASLIDELPNTQIIVGSPPCVDFSMSNRAGKAHKGLGIRLIEAYFRVVAVKKHQRKSVLKAWLMENVPNSRNFVKDVYSFEDLNLADWAKARWPKAKDPQKRVAIKVRSNGFILNAADYGSPQGRKRFICGEIIEGEEFPLPVVTHNIDGSNGLRRFVWLADIKGRMPTPTDFDKDDVFPDPNYKNLRVGAGELTDHFYDTGLYSIEWEKAKIAKVNHPFMGRMAFPEDENRTARTIMATRSASTREAMIFATEYSRKGDGEFRLPTIREIASLMGFPYSYQFVGREGTKWRLIGNAVCPHMSAALAKQIRHDVFNLPPILPNELDFSSQQKNYLKVENLNDSKEKVFDSPPKRSVGAKFREHPFKRGNMTVALMNYLPNSDEHPGKNWYAILFFGSGKDYKSFVISKSDIEKLESIVKDIPGGLRFQDRIKTELLPRVKDATTLQHMFETNHGSSRDSLTPSDVVKTISEYIEEQNNVFQFVENFKLNGFSKQKMPISQLFAAWSLSTVANYANRASTEIS